MSCVRQRESRQRIDAKREGLAPAAEVEWHAVSQIAPSLQYREQKPPQAITPQNRAADYAQAEGDVPDTRVTRDSENGWRLAAEQQQPERGRADWTEREPTGRCHVLVWQLV